MTEVVVAVLSGRSALAETFLKAVSRLAVGAELIVVSEFPPPMGTWAPYRWELPVSENLARCVAEVDGRRIRHCCFLLDREVPLWMLRSMAFRLAPARLIAFFESGDHVPLRPSEAAQLARYVGWRIREWMTKQFRPGGDIYTFFWRMVHPRAWERPVRMLYLRFKWPRLNTGTPAVPSETLPPGVAVVIPSRNGRARLERCLPPLLAQKPDQVIVVDNGSDDGTHESLPFGVECVVSAQPLSFSAAINRGLARVRFARVCLLNNDMEVDPGFLAALSGAFRQVPDLFCATAQIFFPENQRRQETGKAVLPSRRSVKEFPVRCDLPVEGETLSPVLYGSGGCSLFDTAKLRALGGLDESFTPAYVEDLDLGYRGWRQGWPTVFVADARVTHRHRQTTSRYFRESEIQAAVERNFLRFVTKNGLTEMWRETIERHNRSQNLEALRFACGLRVHAAEDVTAAGSGDIAVFPGTGRSGRPVVLVATCYAPFPLSHGGAVRMYNLMRHAAQFRDQVLVYFVDELQQPPKELLSICAEVVQVRRHGSHRRKPGIPDAVDEFRSESFRAALGLMVRKWQPQIAQLEYTQLAQYAADCRPARTILVEHDVTLDLYAQLSAGAVRGDRWESQRQLRLWERFERDAWRRVDAVATMSARDAALVGPRAFVLPNGVDVHRYQPVGQPGEPRRLLFIGAFHHLPNLMALAFFLREVWPQLPGYTLHVIAGRDHAYYREFYRSRVEVNLEQPDIAVEGFVEDVRSAYHRASAVVAPLLASAGTNIKVLEAMAMAKPVVATAAGVHGLPVAHMEHVLIADDAAQMANCLLRLSAEQELARRLGEAARRLVEEQFDWAAIARAQEQLYQSLTAETAMSSPSKNVSRNEGGSSANDGNSSSAGDSDSTWMAPNPASSR